jgi:glycosyltransferase involved in cell wall biosynthesis
VTNDLSYDQRMIRICRSLSANGFAVLLIGRMLRSSIPLKKESFGQVRLSCWFQKGKFFYIEYNIRLWFFLLFQKMDAICAIDLDTILPCLSVSYIRKIPRVYDAHELFTEMKEVISRPAIKKIWTGIERMAVPRFPLGYTVSQSIAEEFNKRYKVHYDLIRNASELKAPGIHSEYPHQVLGIKRFILYQGAVNEARGLEYLIPAMQQVDCPLFICGEGNLMKECQAMTKQYGLEEKVIFLGKVDPAQLAAITQKACIGINLVEPYGLNQVYSLANKFFDYIHAALPQITMDFPEYRRINDLYAVGVLISEFTEKKIADAINNLLENDVLYNMLRNNCSKARLIYNWQEEEKKLLAFYRKHL